MSGLLISGFVVGGFGLLVLIIGAILMATAKACTAADEACNSSKNRKKAGIGMVVMGCVLGVVGGVLLFLEYRSNDKYIVVDRSKIDNMENRRINILQMDKCMENCEGKIGDEFALCGSRCRKMIHNHDDFERIQEQNQKVQQSENCMKRCEGKIGQDQIDCLNECIQPKA